MKVSFGSIYSVKIPYTQGRIQNKININFEDFIYETSDLRTDDSLSAVKPDADRYYLKINDCNDKIFEFAAKLNDIECVPVSKEHISGAYLLSIGKSSPKSEMHNMRQYI